MATLVEVHHLGHERPVVFGESVRSLLELVELCQYVNTALEQIIP